MRHKKPFSVLVRASLLVAVVGLGSLAFWKSHSLLERAHLRKMTAAHARTVRLDMLEEIEDFTMSQFRLAKLLEGQTDRATWEYQGELLIKDYPSIVAEQWVDPAFHVRWGIKGSESDAEKSLVGATDVALQSHLKELKDRGERNTVFTPPFTLWNGKSGLRIVVPVYRQEQLIGFSIATVDRGKLFEDMLEDQADAGFGIIVADQNQEVYKTGIPLEQGAEWQHETEFAVSGLTLRVRVWPEPSLLSGSRSMLVETSLAAGSLIGLLFFAVLELAGAWYSKSEELRRARDRLDLQVQERTAELRSVNKELEVEIHERKQAQQSLQELSGQLMRLRDEEQRRLARELHDSTVQTLCALAIDLERAQIFSARGDASKAQKLLAMSRHLTEQATAEIRTISYLLHPPILDELGLEAVLPWYVAGFTARSGVNTNVNVQPELGRFPQETELTLYRVVQEALTNIHRHSGSSTADISLLRDANRVILQISDRGGGIPREVLEPTGNSRTVVGIGIAGMRERVRQLNGMMEIESSSCGTAIKVVLPIDPMPASRTDAMRDMDTLQVS